MVVTAVLIKELPDHSFLMRLLLIITKQDVVSPPPPSFLYVVCKSINRHVPVFFLKNKNKRHASSFWMLFVGL
jgi:signal recognition particle receptor subunit beta